MRLTLGAEARGLLEAAARSADGPAYLVGGALRDGLLGRPAPDLDMGAGPARSARELARRLASAVKASYVAIENGRNPLYRLVLPRRFKTVRRIDVSPLKAGRIEDDLLRRDFTVNAMALPLGRRLAPHIPAGQILDPRGGIADLERRILRAESEDLLKDDPLRILRAFRLSAELGFSIEPETLRKIKALRALSDKPAAERIKTELLSLLSASGCSRQVRLMDEVRVLTVLFKELEPARRCAVVYYGAGGVLEHSLRTVEREDFLLNHLRQAYPEEAPALESYLSEKSTDEGSQKAVLILACLLHDVAKPPTARLVGRRLRFFGHDSMGAGMAKKIMTRLRFSTRHIDTVATVVAHHLRPGNLAANRVLTDKAAYRFFRDIGEEAPGVLLCTWADHASYVDEAVLLRRLDAARLDPVSGADALKRLRPAEAQKTFHHLQTVSRLIQWRIREPAKASPPKVVDGNDVMRALGLPPGPRIGRAIEKVREAQAEGKISGRKQALDYLKKLRGI